MKLDSTECLNISSIQELSMFIHEYESILVNVSYFQSKVQSTNIISNNNNNFEYLNSIRIINNHERNDTFNNSYESSSISSLAAASSFYVGTMSEINSNNTDYGLLIFQIIKVALYVFMILVGLIGNVVIILVILLNKFMRNSTNYFILNLVLCDLAILFSCVWIQIFLVLNENWILGELFCKVNSYMQMVSLIASVLSLSAVSYNRYFGIMYPLKAKTENIKSYMYIIPIIWVISLIVSLPSFIYRTYREVKWLDYTVRTCDDFGWPVQLQNDERNCPVRVQSAKRIYYTTVILCLFFLPILIMSITYSFIIKKLRRNETLMNTADSGQMNKQNSNALKKRKKVIIMLVWILLVFFLCWCPLEIILLFTEYAPNYVGKLSYWSSLEWVSYFLAFSNCVINPILYAGLNENYKKGINNLKRRILGINNRNDSFYSSMRKYGSIRMSDLQRISNNDIYAKPKKTTIE